MARLKEKEFRRDSRFSASGIKERFDYIENGELKCKRFIGKLDADKFQAELESKGFTHIYDTAGDKAVFDLFGHYAD